MQVRMERAAGGFVLPEIHPCPVKVSESHSQMHICEGGLASYTDQPHKCVMSFNQPDQSLTLTRLFPLVFVTLPPSVSFESKSQTQINI